ncbi:MAG: primosomal protein N' (replication factor Y) [Oceanospirillaceae bacterium]|jgi:primosomal protein N' (replication factor Y)
MSQLQFAEVILPLPLPGTFTYSIPWDVSEEIGVGHRVVVQFGKRKLYTGIVHSIHDHQKPDMQVRPVLEVVDPLPIVLLEQLNLWEWIAEYYLCSIGQVMQAALPAGLKLSSETVLVINPDFDGDVSEFEPHETDIINSLLEKERLSISDIEKILRKKTVHKEVRGLLEKGVLAYNEEIKERYKPKVELFISLSPDMNDEALAEAFNQLERAPKQLETLMVALHHIRSHGQLNMVPKRMIIDDPKASDAALTALVKRGVLVKEKVRVDRIHGKKAWAESEVELTEEQGEAFIAIKKGFEEKGTVLLEGVTSSGKTEIYIKLIKEAIDAGKQCLYMLPEIALTAQFINRLQKYFGEKVGIYHSKVTGNERVELWNRMLDPDRSFGVIVGARSSLWLPFLSLDLVVVDEEHDHSYKQHDPAPRYNGRDTAMVLALKNNANVLMGSATPSLESRYNATNGKYGHVRLHKRYGDIQMPRIVLSDLRIERREKAMKGPFSSGLMELIRLYLERGEQAIIFQNRRGFSPFMECDNCGWVPHCRNCDISLTYHKHQEDIRCHYCGYSEAVPTKCKACNSTYLRTKGVGTEQIEHELEMFFPQAKIGRLDLDTTRTRNSYQQIISDFETGQTDILVGTQMVTKGLDFDNVGLVAVLNADQLLNYPDFRSLERAFQLMVQVSGRAGRKKRQGTVLIQSSTPEHPIIQMVQRNDYETMYESQMEERIQFLYPPFTRLVEVVLRAREENLVNVASDWIAEEFRRISGGPVVLGPEFPFVKRVRNKYSKHILIKLPKANQKHVKSHIMRIMEAFRAIKQFNRVNLHADVDP